MRSGTRRLVATAFALSGCAGLVHELAWARVLSQTLGGSLFAVTAAVAVFLAGLGCGSAWAARAADGWRDPLRVYTRLEAALAIYGVLSCAAPFVVAHAVMVAGPAFESSAALAALRVALAALVLAPPACIMGATLPCLVRTFADPGSADDAAGATVAGLYGINTLGGACGAALGAFVLLPGLGTRGTFVVAAGLNLAAAAIAGSRRGAAGRPAGAAAPRPGPSGSSAVPSERAPIALRLLAAAAVGGAVGGALQIGWTRVVALSFGSTIYALGSVLTAYILGLGLGPLLVRRRLAGGPAAGAAIAAIALGGAGLLSLLLVPVLGRLPVAAARISGLLQPSPFGGLLLQGLLVVAVVLAPSLLQGMTWPALLAIDGAGVDTAHRGAGRLYAVSSWGTIVGVVLAGFAGIPRLGTRAVLIASGIMALLAAIVPALRLPRRRAAAAIAAIAVTAMLVPPLLPRWDARLLSGGAYLYGRVYRAASKTSGDLARLVRRRGDIVFEREDGTALVTVRRTPAGVLSLQINGKTEASTGGDLTTQALSAHLPLLLHTGTPADVLVIGLASGMTLGAVEKHPAGRIEVHEIAPAVVEAAHRFDEWNGRALDDPRVRIVVDDARARLLARPDGWDVITSQPSNPWVAGVANLFTVEFYRLVRARLKPGGLFCQWVQAYRLSGEDFQGIVASFLEVFPNATLWEESAGGGDYFLIGGDGPLRVDPQRLVRDGTGAAWEDLRRAGVESPADLLSRFVSGPRGLARLAGGARRHTDDDPYLEARAPLTLFRDTLRDQLAALRRIREPVLSVIAGTPDPALADDLRARERQRELRLEIAAGLSDPDLLGLEDPYLAAGVAALRAGRPAEALSALMTARAQNPESGTANYLLGQAYRATGLVDAAAVAYAEAVRTEPDLAPAWNALGSALLARGETEHAALAFTRALQIDPALGTARNNLGTLLVRQGRMEDAERAFRDALRSDPDLAAAHANLGFVLRRRGDEAGAEEGYREALRLDPLNTDARYNLAVLLLDRGRMDEAREETGRLLEIDPIDAEAKALAKRIGIRPGPTPARPAPPRARPSREALPVPGPRAGSCAPA